MKRFKVVRNERGSLSIEIFRHLAFLLFILPVALASGGIRLCCSQFEVGRE